MPGTKVGKDSFADTHPYACLLAACFTVGGVVLLLLKGYWYALLGAPVVLLLGAAAYGTMRMSITCKDDDWFKNDQDPSMKA